MNQYPTITKSVHLDETVQTKGRITGMERLILSQPLRPGKYRVSVENLIAVTMPDDFTVQDERNSDWSETDPEIAEFAAFQQNALRSGPSTESISGGGVDCRLVNLRPGEMMQQHDKCSCSAGSTSRLCGYYVSVYHWDDGGRMIAISRPQIAK